MYLRILKAVIISMLLFFIINGSNVVLAHLPVTLYTEDGEAINSRKEENLDQPYSPKETCGTCHDYNSILNGYHFTSEWERWSVLSYRQLAEKENECPDEIDMTAFDFATKIRLNEDNLAFGAFHPGGGMLEFDRQLRRYDDALRENSSLAESFDGDYYNSQWVESGVVEIDCLLCHLPGYDYQARVEQMEKGNLRWAATAGAGLGSVDGSVLEGEEPQVTYDLDSFTTRGTVDLEIVSASDENCLSCHGSMGLRQAGFVWNKENNPDIHNQGEMNCLDCHFIIDTDDTPAINHQIATGKAEVGAAAEFAGTMLSCGECHDRGELGAPRPRHNTIKISHLEYISCQGCHVPNQTMEATSVVDVTTGEIIDFTRDMENVQSTEGSLPPHLQRLDDYIYPVNLVNGVWWGNRNTDGTIVPLYLTEIEAAFNAIINKISNDTKNGHREVNSQEEIIAMLNSLSNVLAENERLDIIQPVYVKGGQTYEIDESEDLLVLESNGIEQETFLIAHNVLSAEEAYGAGGCSDCHNPNSHWIAGQVLKDPWGPDGVPVYTTQGNVLGLNRTIMSYYYIYQNFFRTILFLGILGAFIFTVVHYLVIGPKGKHLAKLPRNMTRYSPLERVSHFIRMGSTTLLIITGIGFALNAMGILNLGGGYYSARTIHILLGVLFIISSLSASAVWYKNALIKSYDIEWFKKFGGYFTKQECHVPAGHFNAGQKIFYWISGILSVLLAVTGVTLILRGNLRGSWLIFAATIHGLSSILLISAVIVHAYLGSAANPGTWRVLVDGKVSEEWCKHHHPDADIEYNDEKK
ncbi:MAG: hypothetical protein APF76_17980 [Desulfitibacter sp. BRH_c19]|nr:MAG: hypothetical protein APF76_17980 [Desulfitibacter sp. BRH_c19]